MKSLRGEPVGLRLSSGTSPPGFRVKKYLGCGYESCGSYLVTERHSNLPRRLKLFHEADIEYEHIGHVAFTFDRLHRANSTPPYHRIGTWHHDKLGTFAYLVLGYVEGKPLVDLLAPGRWRRGSWSPNKALGILHAMAAKLAAVHDTGLAAGDFEHGYNVIIDKAGEPWWIDIDAGTPDEPNTDQESDVAMWFGLLDQLMAHTPESPLVTLMDRRLARIRKRKFRRGTMHDITAVMAKTLEAEG
ncbi:hypothetical protein [Rhodospira trueperi]|uniref:Protein kinase domain-containing protein n=1 Tax=Rhodospira trueperi TaxID=69960 RepID=A0A1G7ELT5_9PROT|nr:hypothetical protein [Rhodospira trueperi]SDE64406.1 hypothetical protein SAMN05421720_109119 [Rhodospira trueperi]